MDLKKELIDWLDKQTITGGNIGDIRRACFMPWDSKWNGIVRDERQRRARLTKRRAAILQRAVMTLLRRLDKQEEKT